MLVRGKPSGFGPNDELTSVEIEIIDAELPDAIDGIGGGTYEPTAQIIIDGSTTATPLFVDGTFKATNLVVTGVYEMQGGGAMTGAHTYYVATSATLDVQAGGTFLCHAPATFSSAATSFTGGASFTGAGTTYTLTAGNFWNYAVGSTVTFASAPTFTNGASFNTGGAVGFAVPVTFASTTTFSTAPTFPAGISGGVSFAGAVSIASTVGFSGSGHAVWRYVFGTNANHDYAVGDTDVVVVRSADISADRIYTMKNTGCTGGEIVHVANESSARSVTLRQDDGSTLIAVLKTASTFYAAATLINDGLGNAASSWHVIGAVYIP